jgi:sporulation protein YlmC with PRC-barrel domain
MSMEVDLGLGVLDHQLVDSEGRRCGKVDDLELEGIREGNPRVVAIVAGPPAWRGRGLLGRLAARVAGGRSTRVPWDEVKEIKSAVHLRRAAPELRLGRGDDVAGRWVARLPWSK